MVKEMILKADFVPVTIINEQRSKLMFKTEDVTNPVYKKDKDGNIIVDEDGNPIIDHYEDTDYCNVLVEYFRGERTESAMRKLIADWYDPETDAKILNGMVWKSFEGEDIPVYLSTENQFNFKSAYDLAVQTEGATLPVTFKMGEKSGVPVYHTFETMEEANDFYTKAVSFINQTLAEGWEKKDNFDWSLYVNTPVTEEVTE